MRTNTTIATLVAALAATVPAGAQTLLDLSGWFATDVMKSEEAGEDVDRNGEEGETFTAQVTASLEADHTALVNNASQVGRLAGPGAESDAALRTLARGSMDPDGSEAVTGLGIRQ